MCKYWSAFTAVIGTFFYVFTSIGLVQSFGIIYVEVLDVFNATNTTSSWIPSLASGLTFTLGPLTGILSKRFGCRFVAIIGSVLMAVGLATSMLVTSVQTLYLTYGVITGAGFGLVYPVGYDAINQHVKKRKSIAMGIGAVGGGVGTIVFPVLCSFLLKAYGWNWTFLTLSGICSLGIIFGILLGPAKTVKDSELTNEKTWTGIFETSKKLWTQFNFVVFLISGFCTSLVNYTPFVMTPELAIQHGVSKDDVSLIITITGISSIVARATVGVVSETKLIDETFLNGIVQIIGGVATIACVHFRNQTEFLIYGVILGYFTGTVGVMQPIISKCLFDEEDFGLAFGYIIFFQGIATTAGLALAGWIADVSGGFIVVYYFSGVVFIVGGVLSGIIWLKPKWKNSSKNYKLNQKVAESDRGETLHI